MLLVSKTKTQVKYLNIKDIFLKHGLLGINAATK